MMLFRRGWTKETDSVPYSRVVGATTARAARYQAIKGFVSCILR
jgi:hypothetical protein